jgi:endonuclease/exonuclease/phosphatase family metal-dependent hydrolase
VVPLSLATFNVKNLLDPQDQAARALLPAKLDAIARVVRDSDADVVGLQEVGPVELLRAVASRLVDRGYVEPILGTADARGIRCALLTRLRVVTAGVRTAESLPFPVFRAGDPPPFGMRIPLRRGVVHARLEAPGFGGVDVFVAHFKSPLPVAIRDAAGIEVEPSSPREHAEGALRSVVWRAAESLFVRGLVDEVLEREPGAHAAVVGDLNDTPGSPVLRALRSQGSGELFDCAAGVGPEACFSVLHQGRPEQIDHVLATASLHARLVDARFLNAELRDHGVLDRTQVEAMTVDSDHALLVVRFV